MSEPTAELKPCPFCGGRAEYREGFSYRRKFSLVECGNSDCAVRPYVKSHVAIAAWNRRADAEQEIKRLRGEDNRKHIKLEELSTDLGAQRIINVELRAELAALREENERLRKSTSYELALKVWASEMRLLSEERDSLRDQLAQMRKPVTTCEWDRAKGNLAYKTGMTFLHDFEIATALIAARAAEPAKEESNG